MYRVIKAASENSLNLMKKANSERRLNDEVLKSQSVNASTSGRKVTGKSWSEFIKNIESQTKFKVDSSSKRRPQQVIDLIDGPDLYEGEVTKYHDGTYELMFSNIEGPFENDNMW